MTGNDILLAKLLYKTAKLLYQLVSDYNPLSVIYILKIININYHDTDSMAIFGGISNVFTQQPHIIITIVKPGQAVIICHISQFFILGSKSGDIIDINYLVRRLAGSVIVYFHTKLHPAAFILHQTFRRGSLFSCGLQEKYLPKPHCIAFVHCIKKLAESLHFPNIEIKILRPLPQNKNCSLFKGTVKECTHCRFKNLLVHSFPVR